MSTNNLKAVKELAKVGALVRYHNENGIPKDSITTSLENGFIQSVQVLTPVELSTLKQHIDVELENLRKNPPNVTVNYFENRTRQDVTGEQVYDNGFKEFKTIMNYAALILAFGATLVVSSWTFYAFKANTIHPVQDSIGIERTR